MTATQPHAGSPPVEDLATELIEYVAASLSTHEPETRVRLARLLAEHAFGARMSAIGDEAIYEMTRAPDATYERVGAQLGVSKNTINKAVKAHRRRTSGQVAG